MGQSLVTFRVKADMPSVEEARQRLFGFLESAESQGQLLIKVIHGYGSTGKGGKLRHALRRSLSRLVQEGKVVEFIPGERWNTTEEKSRGVLSRHPWLKSDADLNRANAGITVVELRSIRGFGVRARRGKGTRQLSSSAPSAHPFNKQEAERLLQEDPARLYDAYSQPHMIRRLKEEP